jgi:hypothetical protein
VTDGNLVVPEKETQQWLHKRERHYSWKSVLSQALQGTKRFVDWTFKAVACL